MVELMLSIALAHAFPEVSRRTDGDFAASSFLGLLF